MKIFRDSESIRSAVTTIPSIAPFLSSRLDDLAEYDDIELDQLVNIVVGELGDKLDDLSAALGFRAQDRPVDVIEAHPGWFELTYVLSDDGFGVVVYVPDDPAIDPRLLSRCHELLQRSSTG